MIYRYTENPLKKTRSETDKMSSLEAFKL